MRNEQFARSCTKRDIVSDIGRDCQDVCPNWPVANRLGIGEARAFPLRATPAKARGMKSYFLVMAGGAVGAALRFQLSRLVPVSAALPVLGRGVSA